MSTSRVFGASAPARPKRVAGIAAATIAIGAVAALVAPSAATAAPVVSQGTGRLITASIAGVPIDPIAALAGAVAVNPDGATPLVVSDTPIDASALADLLSLEIGPNNLPLFGGSGIIQLGAVGQYAQAASDASSQAFSGAVSAAPSLIGVNTVTPSDVGAPTAGSTAQISVGTSLLTGGEDLANLQINVGVLAASASQTADGVQSGDYTLASADVLVGGTLVSGVTTIVSPALDTLIAALTVAGITGITNPLGPDGISLSTDDLLAVAGVASLNDLPVGTNLLTYVPQAVVNQLTSVVDGVLDAAQAAIDELPLLARIVPQAALAVARGIIDPVIAGLVGTLAGPLATAIDAIAQLDVNNQTLGDDGSFTQSALRVGLGPDGSLAAVDLASASVGPNAGIEGVPLMSPEALAIAGGGAAIIGLVVWLRRRRVTVEGTH
ncbi:choice-of-anchor G family protein [Compostimonas suwonensis]|nr:choice-of-anchor G family protein [Compostimonas suwonensis]